LNFDELMLIELGPRPEQADVAPDGAAACRCRPVGASRVAGLLSRDEAGHAGAGEEPVGDADAVVGGL
jgi:hypothetical protein